MRVTYLGASDQLCCVILCYTLKKELFGTMTLVGQLCDLVWDPGNVASQTCDLNPDHGIAGPGGSVATTNWQLLPTFFVTPPG